MIFLLNSIARCRKAIQTLGRGILSQNRLCSSRPYELNTNVAKDVIIFKYENPKFYKYLNIFAVCQFFFWNYLSHFAYTTLRDAPVERDTSAHVPFWRKLNLGDNKYRNTLTILCFSIGWGVLAFSWMITLRSVRFLVLRKGGESVSLVTYTPYGINNRILTVPLSCVSAHESRMAARVQLPLKVKNHSFFYILDKRGTFPNGRLFDYTAGLKRKFT